MLAAFSVLPRVRPGAATRMLQADHPNLTGRPSHSTRVPHSYDEDIVDALKTMCIVQVGPAGLHNEGGTSLCVSVGLLMWWVWLLLW